MPSTFTLVGPTKLANTATAIAAGVNQSFYISGNGTPTGAGTSFPAGGLPDGNVSVITVGSWNSFGYVLCLKTDGSLWAAGNNSVGQLGDGTTITANSPIQIVGGNVTQVAAGMGNSFFIKDDGSLWAMGYNANGELGDGSTANSLVPEQIFPATPPVIATQPGNQTVSAGLKTGFAAQVPSGLTPAYQWQISDDDGNSWNDLADSGLYTGTQTAALVVATNLTMDGDQFRLVATTDLGSATSDAGTLTATETDAVTAQPSDAIVNLGSATGFSLTLGDLPDARVRWQYSTDQGANWSTVPLLLSGFDPFSRYSAGFSFGVWHLYIPQTDHTMANQQFRAEISNDFNDFFSEAATLSFSTPPVVSSLSGNQAVTSGNPVTFSVSAEGTPAPALQWQRSLDGGNSWSNLTEGGVFSGTTSANLTVNPATAGLDQNQFRCIPTNIAGDGAPSPAVTLTVVYLPIVTSQPQNQAFKVGQNAVLSATANGNALAYQWQRFVGGAWQNVASGGRISGATSRQMRINVMTMADAGLYRVVLSNAAGTTFSNSFKLAVQTPPSITTQPRQVWTAQGSTVQFTVKASGDAPLSYQWQENGRNLRDTGGIRGSSTATLTLRNVTPPQSALYRVIVTNGTGSATSASAKLTVR